MAAPSPGASAALPGVCAQVSAHGRDRLSSVARRTFLSNITSLGRRGFVPHLLKHGVSDVGVSNTMGHPGAAELSSDPCQATPPWRQPRGKSQVNLPQMLPPGSSIRMGVD